MPIGVYDRTKSKPNTGIFRNGQIPHNKGIRFSEETKERMRLNHADFTGDKHPRWKGGRVITKRGHVNIYCPEHPLARRSGYVYEHRIVMEKHLGRYLKPDEVVHHKGVNFPIDSKENKSDNSIENLQLLPNAAAHLAIHNHLRSGENHWRNKQNLES